jgi:hypothetical protein
VVQGAGASAGHSSVNESFKLPGPGGIRVELLTVKLTRANGPVGSPSVTSLDRIQLPAGIRAIAAVSPASSSKRSATFKVLIGINDLSTAPGYAHESGFAADLRIRVTEAKSLEPLQLVTRVISTKDLKFPADCGYLVSLGNKADLDFVNRAHNIDLIKEANEPSDPEAILDFIAYGVCRAQGAEVPDGDGPQ